MNRKTGSPEMPTRPFYLLSKMTTSIQHQDYSSITIRSRVAKPAGCAYTTKVYMQTNQSMSFSRRDTASGRCERPTGAKNLAYVPEASHENEILRRSAPQNDIA